jgi:hypothetical protein
MSNTPDHTLGNSPYPPKPSRCKHCGAPLELATQRTKDDNVAGIVSVDNSEFVEKYQCTDNADHIGQVSGDEFENPKEWTYAGCCAEPDPE